MADPALTLPILLGVVLCGLCTIVALHYSSYWLRDPKSGARLPKGTFGWPIIGETFTVTRDPLGFARSHQQRYGSIFKSNIFLRKTILGPTAEFAKFVTANPRVFKVQYPESVSFISPNAVFFKDGPRQVAVKKVFKRFTVAESLQTMIQPLESIILENLASWEAQGTLVGSDGTDQLVADTSSYISLGVKNIRSTPEGRLALKNMLTMIDCIKGLPINLPGTTHSKGRKARAAVRAYLKSIVDQRKKQVDTECDILRTILEAREKAEGSDELKYYDEDSIIDEMVGAWFAAFKTTATTLTWILKFLVDYPDVLKKIQAEQQEILNDKDLSATGPRLTYDDAKKMVYTSKVYQEVQRILSISFVLARKAVEDVVYEGLLIPKGWAVLLMVNYVHHDPANYEDPMTFNPNRFTAAPKPNTYLPFGLGSHRCPGEEITKLIFLIYVHYLSTTYKYDRVGPDQGIEYLGFPQIVGGYPIKFSRQT
ncbi:unnamed protein product [Calypogeia fissa]